MAQHGYSGRLRDGEIRLLRLKSESYRGELAGELVIRWLDLHHVQRGSNNGHLTITIPDHGPSGVPTAEDYFAMSYHWGVGLPAKRRIWLDREPGQEPVPFSIKENLETALLLLRLEIKSPKTDRLVWIDALCINQRDSSEKSMQIPIMAEIYSHANAVCVWLGESNEAERSDSAMKFIEEVTNFNITDQLFEKPEENDNWNAFCKLLNRDWFARRWVIQEIAVARKAIVYCGKERVDWLKFSRAVSLFSSRPEHLRKLFKADIQYHNPSNKFGDISKLGASWLASQLSSLVRKDGDGRVLDHMLSLESLMSKLTLFKAGDPKDLLYSILWLASDVRPSDDAVAERMMAHSTPGTPTGEDGPSGLASPTGSEDSNISCKRRASVDVHMGGSKRSRTALAVNGHPMEPNAPPHGVDLAAAGLVSDVRAGIRERSATQITASVKSHGSTLTVPPQGASISLENQVIPRFQHHQVKSPSEIERIRFDRPLTSASSLLGKESEESRQTTASESTLQAVNEAYSGPGLTIKIDYKKNVYDVCLDFITHAFKRYGYIDMMCRPWAPDPIEWDGTDKEKDYDWIHPSWMLLLGDNVIFKREESTGFQRRVRADPLVGTSGEMGKRSYRATGLSRAFERRKTNGLPVYPPTIGHHQDLELKGFVLGTVQKTGGCANNAFIPKKWLKLINWNPAIKNCSLPPETFWRTLVANRGLDEYSEPPPWFEAACEWAFQQRIVGEGLEVPMLLRDEVCPTHAAEFLQRVENVVFQRVLFKCQTPLDEDSIEYLGLGPEDLETGDLICILYGCSVPVVLRQQDEQSMRAWSTGTGKPRFTEVPQWPQNSQEIWCRFVGECYVHGMMDGEIFRHKRKFEKFPHGGEQFRIF